MASLYQRGFASDAVITYIPTAIAISGSSAIEKHLDSKEIRIRAQKVIGRIETTESLVLDVENHVEFLTAGGAYLPGLDNFITDKTVTFASVSFARRIQARLLTMRAFLDSHYPSEWCWKCLPSSHTLGSSIAVETGRRNRLSQQQLADHRQPRTNTSRHILK